MSIVVGDRRLTELTPGELGTISALSQAGQSVFQEGGKKDAKT